MNPHPPSLAILFADISGSTRLYETLGDQTALGKIDQCLTLLGGIARRHGGEIIKTIGDEILCAFSGAEMAVEAAMAMQQEMERAMGGMRIRIGLHSGEVIREGGDVFGDAVNVAARMAGLAAAEQIITTRDTVDALSPLLRASVRYLGLTSVKGKREEVQICEVLWRTDAEMTMMPTALPGGARKGHVAALRLEHGGRQLQLNAQQPSAIVGRGNECELVVNDPLASRRHANIELRNGKFFLADQSTNGTYLTQGGKTLFLHREEMALADSGQFGLGHEVATTAPEAVHFTCE